MAETKQTMKRAEALEPESWLPFREIEDMRKTVSELVEDVLAGGAKRRFELLHGRRSPAVNVEQTEKEYLFSMELPGLDREDFKVELENGVLTISGEKKQKKEEKGRNFLRQEQCYGAFRRSFSMPSDAASHGVHAAYKNGILKISVPRSATDKSKATIITVE